MADHYVQDPNDKLDWSHDWSDFLAAGDSIASRVWSIDPEGGSPSLIVSGGTSASVLIGNLTVGVVYRLSEKITTTNGVIAERSLTIRCEEK
jgi:hypothetical protein